MSGDHHLTFTGLGVALATPFTTGTESGPKPADTPAGRGAKPAVDLAAFGALVDYVIRPNGEEADGAEGVDYLVVLGSTGEAATVSDDERSALIRTARDRSAGAVPVVVGVGHNDTVRTAELAAAAVADGADGLLVVTPYYNKPQASGLVAHYAQVAAAAPGVPIIAYNVPGRTGINMTPEVLTRLWSIPEIVAVKESSGDLRQLTQMCQQAPAGRSVLAGDDDLALPAIAAGARGLISVCANVAPAHTAALVRAALSSQMEEARRSAHELAPLMDAMFAETNPVPVKAALACLGLSTGMVRAPLAPAEPDTWARVHAAMSAIGLVSRRSNDATTLAAVAS